MWENFKKNFIQKDGRVVDPHNHNITHTESIGYTLYFSYKMDDKEVFNKVYNWSKNNLVKNESGLMGWKWGRDRKKRCWCMLDLTSASDANLWIAYSLYLMYERTGEFSYKKDADSLIDAIKKHQIISVNNETFLLSWEKKLIGSDAIQLNPSYLIFEIFEYMAKKDKDIIWNKLIKSSILLLKKARFSSLELNSDWVIYNLREDRYYLPLKHKLFGYDAIRVPLNIMRSNLPLYEKRALLKPYKNYIDMMPRVPLGVANLETGEISIYNLSFGHLAVYQKIEQIFNIDRTLFRKKLEDRIEDDDDDYYAYSLYLLTIL
ncbi:MAG: glycosyl hydrolase family 8 [Campylobacterota bacterium]|nr:glycosyl hydrolase family 8 [Campylobacterota bacterium]